MNSEQHASISRTAFFRFYEELNDFLIEEQFKTSFPYEFIGRPSIKDTIEAIGVPHTEIDLILVDGESVSFDYQMYGGETISAYPVFSLYISSMTTICTSIRSTRILRMSLLLDGNLNSYSS